jgi:hypothetical protein
LREREGSVKKGKNRNRKKGWQEQRSGEKSRKVEHL